jgi:alpha-N-arabinofuranosidase
MLRTRLTFVLAAASLVLAPELTVRAQQPVTLTVRADRPGVRIDPMFYGLMTEEINFSYDGGLYAELIRNRTLRDDAAMPVHWSVVEDGGG